MEKSNKIKKIICIAVILVLVFLCAVAAAAVTYRNNRLGGTIYTLISTGKAGETDFYAETRMVGGWKASVSAEYLDNLDEFVGKNEEIFKKINSKYVSPTEIHADCFIKDKKTYVHYVGTATDGQTGKAENVDETLEFDFVLTRDIQNMTPEERSSEAAENRQLNNK